LLFFYRLKTFSLHYLSRVKLGQVYDETTELSGDIYYLLTTLPINYLFGNFDEK
jgi:hypothetical protein